MSTRHFVGHTEHGMPEVVIEDTPNRQSLVSWAVANGWHQATAVAWCHDLPGATRLAEMMLWAACGERKLAERYAREFATQVISWLPRAGWELAEWEVGAWLVGAQLMRRLHSC